MANEVVQKKAARATRKGSASTARSRLKVDKPQAKGVNDTIPRLMHPMQIGSLVLLTLGSIAQLLGQHELGAALVGGGVLCGGKTDA